MRVKKILVVDDEPLVRRFLRVCLSKAGYQVLEAQQGVDAILLARGVDLVITDVLMPQMNGYELAAYLTQITGIDRVLVISGGAAQDLERVPGFARPNWFLPKPFTEGELTGTVHAIFGDAGEVPLAC